MERDLLVGSSLLDPGGRGGGGHLLGGLEYLFIDQSCRFVYDCK